MCWLCYLRVRLAVGSDFNLPALFSAFFCTFSFASLETTARRAFVSIS